jgi:sugar/nucleoside kinase (ribokinase family)
VTRFVVVGDAILDVTVAPSRPVRAGGDVSAVIRLGPGGQGANVAVRLARRGREVVLAAPMARDAGGALLRKALGADGVQLASLPASRTAVVVALLDAGGERSMLSDRQTIPAAHVERALADAGWIHASAYALIDDAAGDALATALGARPDEARLSVAGGSISPEPAVVSRFLARLAVVRPDVIVLSREEAAALLGRPAEMAREAAMQLADRAPLVVVTAGSLGCAAALGGTLHEVAAPQLAGPAIDSTGAGDAFVATLVARLADGRWPPAPRLLREAMDEASRAGGLVSRVLGAQARIDGEAGA